MKLDKKYLPAQEDQVLFIQNRINENKKQLLGGQLEILMATANGEARTVKQVEDQMEQLVKNIDIYEKELQKIS